MPSKFSLSFLETLVAFTSKTFHRDVDSYCHLETADGVNALVTHNGARLSLLKIDGSMDMVGSEEFNDLHEGFTRIFLPYLSKTGHSVQVFFEHNPEYIEKKIDQSLWFAKNTAKSLNLDVSDILSERASHLSHFCSDESFYIVLWTHPQILTPEQIDLDLKEKANFIKKYQIKPSRYCQNICAAIDGLRDLHDTFVDSVSRELKNLNVRSAVLDVHTALRHLRVMIDPSFTHEEVWRPSLPGDPLPLREYSASNWDISEILWPPIAKQIFPRDITCPDFKTVHIGDRYYSSVFFDLFPRELKPFSYLFRRLLDVRIPWRISMMIDGNALSTIQLKSALASILSFTSMQNRLICDANNLLKTINMTSDMSIVRIKAVASTWCSQEKPSDMMRRVSELVKCIENWGVDVSEKCGDPFYGFVASVPALSASSPANPSVAPLDDLVYMWPLGRPSSPWSEGAVLFRTPDGKLYPYQPGSSQQTTWVDLFFAKPGSGKSVLSNVINLALCFSPDIKELPYISIIDIGPSSSGLISLLREALPRDKQSLVAYMRLQMTPKCTINPFDTQLGCRYPSPQERSFLVNFLTLLVTPIGLNHPYDGVTDMSGLVINELYKAVSEHNPYPYTADVEPMIDVILKTIEFSPDSRTTWWEIVDILFTSGFVREARVAQRYAMPLLSDVVTICRTPAIHDLYANVTVPTGENLIDAFCRMISTAVREYPIIAGVTQFDFDNARVVALDLDDVAKSGGEAADRQTAVMYMIARYVLGKNFYLTADFVENVPQAYRHYYQEKIEINLGIPKRIVYDEFHRTSRSIAVREQVICDMREGRKWKVQVALISQSLDDFDKTMIEFATSIYILDAGHQQTLDQVSEVFGFSSTATHMLKTRVHGPNENGVSFLAYFSTKDGSNMQILTSTVGPVELWALNTTVEDVLLREKLYHVLGPHEARKILARLFPSGSAMRLVDRKLRALKEGSGYSTDINTFSIVEKIAEKIIQDYKFSPDLQNFVDF